jgi:hypothetical protein
MCKKTTTDNFRNARNEPEFKNKYHIEITNRFATFVNLNTDEDVNREWENIKENIKA